LKYNSDKNLAITSRGFNEVDLTKTIKHEESSEKEDNKSPTNNDQNINNNNNNNKNNQ
jgi:hypothetical protein